MKKPKKVAAPDKAPETDADALLDIVTWSAARPAWQQQALRYLAQAEQLSNGQLDELYKLVLAGDAASSPVSDSDLRSPKSQSAAVTLKAVSKPEDVNALAADQTLSFGKAGLTIIYGDNGAGKSGYARILKHACRARIDGKASPIIPNIYAAAPGTPRAKISYVVNGQNKHADWQLGQASPPDLSAVSVFDSRTALVHVDGTNEVADVPSSLDLMQRLAKTADQLRDKIKADKSTLEGQTPPILKAPPVGADTEVAKALKELKHDADPAAIRAMSVLSDESKTTLTDLRRDLGTDPVVAARQIIETRDGLARFSNSIEQLCQASSGASLAELRTFHAAKTATQIAAEAAAQNRFGQEPLPNVGSETWRALWEAAHRYAITEARPDRPFPPTAADDHCPLCQQSLSVEALDRLARFEAFIRDDTKQQVDRAAKAFSERIAIVVAAKPSMAKLSKQLRYIGETLGDASAQEVTRRVMLQAFWQLRKILRSHADQSLNLPDIVSAPATNELKRMIAGLQTRHTALSADAQSPERRALVANLASLEARSWLVTILPDIEAEIVRKKQLHVLDRALTETDTRVITQKSGALAEALITDTLRAQFAKEIDALGIGTLALELKKEQSQVGAARFRVRLVRKPSAAVGTVLSEGEHRCVALAAFLAEPVQSRRGHHPGFGGAQRSPGLPERRRRRHRHTKRVTFARVRQVLPRCKR